jgi:hypothetical protein
MVAVPELNRWRVASIVIVAALAGEAPAHALPTSPGASGNPATATPAATATPQPAQSSEDEGEPRMSLPTEADKDAWQRSGFRFGLGLSYGRLHGLEGAPSGRLLGALIRLGLRLDADWSVMASFQYQLASATGGLAGLRFAGTLDPTWHVTPHLALAIGLGFGGIVEANTGRADVAPLPSTLATSYTFPGASPPLPACSGVGVAGLVRAEWSFVLGPRASTSLMAEATGQWTGCVADTGLVDNDTGQAIVRRQWWPHVGATAAWGITWR